MQQQPARPLFLMIINIAKGIGADMQVIKPKLAVFNARISVLQAALAGTQ
jgi:hypothetical protein